MPTQHRTGSSTTSRSHSAPKLERGGGSRCAERPDYSKCSTPPPQLLDLSHTEAVPIAATNMCACMYVSTRTYANQEKSRWPQHDATPGSPVPASIIKDQAITPNPPSKRRHTLSRAGQGLPARPSRRRRRDTRQNWQNWTGLVGDLTGRQVAPSCQPATALQETR